MLPIKGLAGVIAANVGKKSKKREAGWSRGKLSQGGAGTMNGRGDISGANNGKRPHVDHYAQGGVVRPGHGGTELNKHGRGSSKREPHGSQGWEGGSDMLPRGDPAVARIGGTTGRDRGTISYGSDMPPRGGVFGESDTENVLPGSEGDQGWEGPEMNLADGGEVDPGLHAAATDIISAISEKDPMKLVYGLRAFMDVAGNQSDLGSEGDGGEEPGVEQ